MRYNICLCGTSVARIRGASDKQTDRQTSKHTEICGAFSDSSKALGGVKFDILFDLLS